MHGQRWTTLFNMAHPILLILLLAPLGMSLAAEQRRPYLRRGYPGGAFRNLARVYPRGGHRGRWPSSPNSHNPHVPHPTNSSADHWCGTQGRCGCPVESNTIACPRVGTHRQRQRRCYVEGHCPPGYSCCRDSCYNYRRCIPSQTTPRPYQRPAGTRSWSAATRNPVTASPTNQLPRTAGPQRHGKVRVSVVQTAACGDSEAFLRTQLHPFARALDQHLQIDLISYGKVDQNGRCQFGHGDCLANRLILCAAQHMPDQVGLLAFSVCFMANSRLLKTNDYSNIISAAMKCAERSPGTVQKWHYCGVGLEGFQLFQKAGSRQQQLAPKVTQVPTVALDGVVVIRRAADLIHFPALLCEKLQGVPAARPLCQPAFTSHW